MGQEVHSSLMHALRSEAVLDEVLCLAVSAAETLAGFGRYLGFSSALGHRESKTSTGIRNGHLIRLFDRREDGQRPAALWAGGEVNGEDACESLGPAHVGPR